MFLNQSESCHFLFLQQVAPLRDPRKRLELIADLGGGEQKHRGLV